MSAGFKSPFTPLGSPGGFNFGATSRVIRKYGSWSIAHGIKQGTSKLPLKISGKLPEKLQNNNTCNFVCIIYVTLCSIYIFVCLPGCRLNGRKTYFAHTVGITKSENSFYLIVGDRLFYPFHIPIKRFWGGNIIQIRKNKSLVHIKSTGNNILTNWL